MRKKFDRSLLPDAPTFEFEEQFVARGLAPVAGIDEAGRGPWAGPVTAGAVILPLQPKTLTVLQGVRDSKQLTPKKRTHFAEIIKEVAIAWQVVHLSAEQIDAIGILPATRKAMHQAVEALCPAPQALVVDAVKFPSWDIPQENLIKGDQRSLSIAAASILAKVARDALMCQYAEQYPAYGFEQHKGYGTKQHQAALAANGPCAIHRKSYRPIKACLQVKEQDTLRLL